MPEIYQGINAAPLSVICLRMVKSGADHLNRCTDIKIAKRLHCISNKEFLKNLSNTFVTCECQRPREMALFKFWSRKR